MTTFTVSTYTTTPSTLAASDWLVVSRFGTIHASVSLLGAAVTGAGSNAVQVDGFVTNTADDGYGIGLQAANNTVVIGATGFVRADGPGVATDGGGNTISCAGTIHSFGSFGIRGGLGGDLIGFNAGDNGDLIQNFNEGGARDGLDLRGYFNATGYTGTTPRAAGIMQVLQNGADTDVYLHGAFAFRIQGVVAAAIDDSYFLFQ